jgi:hypothetical protein
MTFIKSSFCLQILPVHVGVQRDVPPRRDRELNGVDLPQVSTARRISNLQLGPKRDFRVRGDRVGSNAYHNSRVKNLSERVSLLWVSCIRWAEGLFGVNSGRLNL